MPRIAELNVWSATPGAAGVRRFFDGDPTQASPSFSETRCARRRSARRATWVHSVQKHQPKATIGTNDSSNSEQPFRVPSVATHECGCGSANISRSKADSLDGSTRQYAARLYLRLFHETRLHHTSFFLTIQDWAPTTICHGATQWKTIPFSTCPLLGWRHSNEANAPPQRPLSSSGPRGVVRIPPARRRERQRLYTTRKRLYSTPTPSMSLKNKTLRLPTNDHLASSSSQLGAPYRQRLTQLHKGL